MIRSFLRNANDGVGQKEDDDASDRSASSVARGMHARIIALLPGALAGLSVAAPAVALATGQPPAGSPYVLTPERLAASTAALAALVGAVAGGLALARSVRGAAAGTGRRAATVGLILGLLGAVIGGVVVTTAEGGVGTGNGLAGGVVAMALGLIAVSLGGMALARSRGVA